MAKLLWWVDLCSESRVAPAGWPSLPQLVLHSTPSPVPQLLPTRAGRQRSLWEAEASSMLSFPPGTDWQGRVVINTFEFVWTAEKPPMVTINVYDWRFAVLLDLCGKKSSYEGKTSSSLIRKFYYAPGSPRYIFFPKKSFENIYIFVRQGLCLEDCEEAGDSGGC